MHSGQPIDHSEAVEPERLNPTQWLDRHGDVLFRFTLLRVHDRELAEDLVQETFLAALDAQKRFSQRSSERTWLVGILRRKVVDHFCRSARASKSAEAEMSEDPLAEFFSKKGHWKTTLAKWPTDPAGTLENKEFWQVFDQCTEKLPSALFDAFCLREVEQLSTQEVCQILDISATNLAVRIHRARLILRTCLERNWFTDKDSRD